MLIVIVRLAAGLVAIPTSCGPPSLFAVSAYGPPGTASVPGPPSVLTVTVSGAAVSPTSAWPPPVRTVAVVAATPRASSGPPPVSAYSGPVRPSTSSGPPSVVTFSAPSVPAARTGPPLESRFAPAAPDTAIGAPSVATVTATPRGTVTAKLTPQLSLALHTGSAKVRRPPDTDCVTEGGQPPCGSHVIVSVTWTRRTGPAVTCTGVP